MEPWVHGFASNDTHVSPWPQYKSPYPAPHNGYAMPAPKVSTSMDAPDMPDDAGSIALHNRRLAQKREYPAPADADPYWDTDLYDENVDHSKREHLPPYNNNLRMKKRDISESNMDAEVHGIASDDTHVLPWPARRR